MNAECERVQRRQPLIIAAVLAVLAYFSAAYYFKATYVSKAPKDGALLLFPLFQKTRHVYAAHGWLPDDLSQAVVYEDSTPLGLAEAVYDDPVEKPASGGKRWRFIEFTSPKDPNTSGHTYWAVRP